VLSLLHRSRLDEVETALTSLVETGVTDALLSPIRFICRVTTYSVSAKGGLVYR